MVQEAFNLGTINGARALGMSDVIGSIKVGKLADIVVLDGLSPAMVCAADIEPVAAIVLHSSPQDVVHTIVDGKLRKKDGKLMPMNVEEPAKSRIGKEVLVWRDVAMELVESREEIDERASKIDFEEAKQGMVKAFYIDQTKIVDDVPN
jgi:formylmethanofuran dehydrogenase subunit A